MLSLNRCGLTMRLKKRLGEKQTAGGINRSSLCGTRHSTTGGTGGICD